MSLIHWVAAGLLAAFHLYSGAVKLVRSRERLRPMMRWVDTTPMAGVRALGGIEVLGAIGVVAPTLTGIVPVLALVAALGLLVLQVLATTFHLRRGETEDLWLNIALVVLAAAAASTTPW